MSFYEQRLYEDGSEITDHYVYMTSSLSRANFSFDEIDEVAAWMAERKLPVRRAAEEAGLNIWSYGLGATAYFEKHQHRDAIEFKLRWG